MGNGRIDGPLGRARPTMLGPIQPTAPSTEWLSCRMGKPNCQTSHHAALVALQAGAPDVATRQIVGYASNTKTEHHKGGDLPYENPRGREVQDALTRELQDAYRHMPKDMQRQLETAIAEAKKANPEAWISTVKLSK